MNEEEAKKRIEELKSFRDHLTSYISVNGFLFLINMFTSPEYWWFLFPMLGWGIGLFIHMVQVYGFFRFGGYKWEQQKLQELMGRGNEEDFKRLDKRLKNLEIIIENRDRDLLNARSGPDPLLDTSGQTAKSDIQKLVNRIQDLETIVTRKDWERDAGAAESLPENPEEHNTPDLTERN